MTVLLSILITVGVLAGISVVLGVLNWLQLSSSSSRAARLEAEIDKKTREFDLLRKEHANAAPLSAHQVLLDPSEESHHPVVSDSHGDVSEIEVVRSVRAGTGAAGETTLFRQSGMGLADTQSQHADEQHPDVQPEPASDTGGRGKKGSRRDSSSTREGITVRISSDAGKGADCARALSGLSEALSHMDHPHISLDFTGVGNLDDGDIGDLERFAQAFAEHGGTLRIVNVSPDVAVLLRSKRALARLIKK